MKENDDYLESLKDSLDESSKYNRRLVTGSLLFIFYILITVVSTTDLQLLIPDSKIRLPLINAELPLFDFYFVAPLLIIVFHYNLLFSLLQHSKKLLEWHAKKRTYEDSLLLNPFLFNYLKSFPERNIDYYFYKIVVWFVLFLPLITLVIIQGRFSAYHDLKMTSYHFFSFVFDSFLIFIYAYRIMNPELSEHDSFKAILKFKLNKIKCFFSHPLKKKFLKILKIAPLLLITLLSIQNLTTVVLILNIQNIQNKSILNFVAKYKKYKVIPHLELSGKTLVSAAPTDDIIQRYLAIGKTKDDAFKDFAKGLDLRGRDLRLANFDGSILRKVNLNQANLQGASLWETELQESDMGGAQLQRAVLHQAHLQGSFLGGANFKDASLSSSELDGADLSGSELQGASLYGASLPGANLSNTKLQGANLSRAALIGADLANAQLQGAHLGGTYLCGAIMASGNLQGASLTDARLQGALLERALLQGAYLDKAKLKGANLNNAHTEGVLFESIDTKSVVNWDKLLKFLESRIPEESLSFHFYPKEFFKRRIEEAKKRDKSINSKYLSVLQNDYAKFVNFRQQLVCQDIYIAEGILYQGVKDEKTSNKINKSIYEYMVSNCPNILKEVKNRGRINFSFLK